MRREIGRREFLRRGTAAGVLAAAGLHTADAAAIEPGAVTPAPSTQASMQPGAEHSPALLDRQLDSQAFSLSEYDSITPALHFAAPNAKAARQWQHAARRRLIERLGGLPTTRAALRPEVLERRDFGTYLRERIVFQTRDNLSAIGYLLLPTDRPRPLPAIVCFSGHGRGVDDLLGIAPDGTEMPTRGAGYAKEYALQCVEHGYATFALEQLGFGARRDAAARKAGPAENSCRPAACAALLFGQTMIGLRAWDAMRAIDYLATRPEIDMRRVATLGASGGGTTSLFTAALDDRVRVGVVSAYFNTFRDSIVRISHCPDNYVPGLVRDMEMSDVAGLVAPRCLFIESGRLDQIFPIEGSQRAADQTRQIFRTLGAEERMGYQIHEGAHEFHGVGAFEFLHRWM
jgi:cephalosporin-C deacetylase-like acetyl esterase